MIINHQKHCNYFDAKIARHDNQCNENAVWIFQESKMTNDG